MEEDNPQMLEKVLLFVATELGIDRRELTPESTIETDVGIAGLDTELFYQAFFTTFGIANVEEFDADKFISSEGLDFGIAIRSLFSKQAREKLKLRDVSIRHLARVASQKCWYEP